jgi:hypothetical protein
MKTLKHREYGFITSSCVITVYQQTSSTGGAPVASDGALESLRSALQAAIGAYAANCHPSEESAGAVFAKDGTMFVCITGEKPNLRNYWGGKWASSWTIDTAAHTISGEIKVERSHIFFLSLQQLQS